MATTITKYNQVSELLANGAIDFDAATIKLALVTSSYTFDANHDEWADASTNELVDASYSQKTLGSVTLVRSGTTTTFDAADVTWTALTGTFRRGILYISGTTGGKTNPLLAAILFDSTPADITLAAVNFQVVWNASGIFTIG